MSTSNFPPVEQVTESPDPTKGPCLLWTVSLPLEKRFQMCEKQSDWMCRSRACHCVFLAVLFDIAVHFL